MLLKDPIRVHTRLPEEEFTVALFAPFAKHEIV